VIHFTALDKDVVRADLVKAGISPTLAMVIPEYTNNLDEAVRIGQSEPMSAVFRLVLDLYDMAGKPKKSMVLAFKEKREELLPDRDSRDFFLTLMILYQKDLLNAKLRRTDQIVYRTETERLTKCAESVGQKTIQESLERMLALKSRLRFNINSWLAFDCLLAHLERGFQHAA
jgi:DNA polymerase-3 subunit delta'